MQSLPELTIPPLPDPPNANLVEDQDYVEQKRLQVERFLVKMGRRSEFVAHGDVRYFLSSEMVGEAGEEGRRAEIRCGFFFWIAREFGGGDKCSVNSTHIYALIVSVVADKVLLSSAIQSHTDAVDPRKGPVLGFLNQIIKPNYDRGFKVYRPSESVEEVSYHYASV